MYLSDPSGSIYYYYILLWYLGFVNRVVGTTATTIPIYPYYPSPILLYYYGIAVLSTRYLYYLGTAPATPIYLPVYSTI